MMLKEATAATFKLGPFVDETDGFTAETGLTIAQADIRLSKNGGAFAQTNNAAGATHDENGWYAVPLDTTDTDTLGRLTVAVHVAGARPVYREFEIVIANVFDAQVGADRLQVDVREMQASVIASGVIDTVELDNITDRILTRDWTSVGAPAARSVLNALRALRNRFAIAGAQLVVYEEDDVTGAWSAAVSTYPNNPIAEIDPF